MYFSPILFEMCSKSILYIFSLLSTFLFSQENVEVLGNLPEAVSETSGLIFYNGKLITHNDSGNSPKLFEIDAISFQITRTVTVENVQNIDWEDITQDEQYIYIGDFGNNKGMRTDLGIYRINKQAYDQDDSVTAERIDFSYEDQTEFTDSGNSDWDAEAFFVLNNQLVVLTKQWQSNGTVAYSIPKTPGTYIAKKIDAFDSGGLVTGATYNTLSKALFLVGYYSTLSPFVIRVDEVTDTSIFTEKLERTNLNIGFAQIEGIMYADINTYYLSSELFIKTSPSIRLESQLFTFKTEDTTDEAEDPTVDPKPVEKDIIVFKGEGTTSLEYELNTNEPIMGRAIFDTTGRLVQYVSGSEITENTVDVTTLKTSVYYLTFYFKDRTLSIPFSRN